MHVHVYRGPRTYRAVPKINLTAFAADDRRSYEDSSSPLPSPLPLQLILLLRASPTRERLVFRGESPPASIRRSCGQEYSFFALPSRVYPRCPISNLTIDAQPRRFIQRIRMSSSLQLSPGFSHMPRLPSVTSSSVPIRPLCLPLHLY